MNSAVVALLAPFIPFAVSTAITPGPNNMMAADAGAQVGFRRAVPMLAGMATGFMALNLAAGLGVAAMIVALPAAFLVLKIAGVGYLGYLAWRVATAPPPSPGSNGRPRVGYTRALAFQWVNPKAWMMAIGAMATYTTAALDLRVQVLLLTGAFLLIGLSCTVAWTIFGQFMGRWLTSPRKHAAFSWTMAALLVVSIVPVIWERAR